MNKKTGLKLIEELKNDPKKFYDEGKSYQLSQAYYKGLSKDTLRPLFYIDNKWVKRIAVWVTSELGADSVYLFKEVLEQINDGDPYVCGYALEMVAAYAKGEYFNDFINVFSFLENENQQIRLSVMGTISALPVWRLREAYEYLADKKIYGESHKKGFLSLIGVDDITPFEVAQMLGNDDAIIRKYGVMTADKLYKKHPEIIKEAVNNTDSDVGEFSKRTINAEIEFNRIMGIGG